MGCNANVGALSEEFFDTVDEVRANRLEILPGINLRSVDDHRAGCPVDHHRYASDAGGEPAGDRALQASGRARLGPLRRVCGLAVAHAGCETSRARDACTEATVRCDPRTGA